MDAALERTWMYSQRVWNDYNQIADVARIRDRFSRSSIVGPLPSQSNCGD